MTRGTIRYGTLVFLFIGSSVLYVRIPSLFVYINVDLTLTDVLHYHTIFIVIRRFFFFCVQAYYLDLTKVLCELNLKFPAHPEVLSPDAPLPESSSSRPRLRGPRVN